jgi:competence protein ComFC
MIKDLIHLYKFHHHRNIAHVLTDLIWSELKERGLTSSVMVPVPCSRHGRKARGFDQCSLIASDLRKRYKMEVCDPLVKRTRGSTQQKRLNRAERIDCEKSRFYVNRSLKKQTAGRHVILFDDIITTGSTLTEAAGVLTACQCKEISALVLAMD